MLDKIIDAVHLCTSQRVPHGPIVQWKGTDMLDKVIDALHLGSSKGVPHGPIVQWKETDMLIDAVHLNWYILKGSRLVPKVQHTPFVYSQAIQSLEVRQAPTGHTNPMVCGTVQTSHSPNRQSMAMLDNPL